MCECVRIQFLIYARLKYSYYNHRHLHCNESKHLQVIGGFFSQVLQYYQVNTAQIISVV